LHIQGRLVVCEAEARVVKSDGSIYFPLPDRRLGVPFNQQFKHLVRIAGVNVK